MCIDMATEKKKKKITIDDLAMMVARGFGSQDKEFNKRFDGIDERLDGIDRKLVQHDVRFDMLEQRVDGLEEKVDEKFDKIMTAIDGLVKLIETYHHEQMALHARMDRHEEWIKKIAEKVGVQLDY